MYREIEKSLVARDADAARIICPACGLTARPSTRECGCGYDLTRELQDPADLFRREIQRGALRLILIGGACLSPWVFTLWVLLSSDDHELRTPSTLGWTLTAFGVVSMF